MGDADAFVQTLEEYQGSVYACLTAEVGEQAGMTLFAQAFLSLAGAQHEIDPDADPDITVYRFLLRARKRHEGAVEPAGVLQSIAADDLAAVVLLHGSELGIGKTAEALRRPMPRVQEAIVRGVVATVADELSALAPSEIEDEQIAMVAMRWVEPPERAAVENDPAASERHAVLEAATARLRDLIKPKDPPPRLVEKVVAEAKNRISSEPGDAPVAPRRLGRLIAAGVVGAAILGGAGYGGFLYVSAEPDEPEVAEEAAPEPEPEPPAPAPAPEELPVIEYAAQGPPLASKNPRFNKASRLARRHKCKKAARLFAKLLDRSEVDMSDVAPAMDSCSRWMKSHKGDKALEAFVSKASAQH